MSSALLVDRGRLAYLWDLLSPLVFLPLLAPLILIAIVPELLLNMLSNDPSQYSIFYQYTAVITPFLIVAMIGGIARARRLSGTWGRAARRDVGRDHRAAGRVAGVGIRARPDSARQVDPRRCHPRVGSVHDQRARSGARARDRDDPARGAGLGD